MTAHSDDENSSQAARLARIIAHATATFGNRDKADRWLREPRQRFMGHTAMDIAVTEHGAQLVEQALIQIDEGYFA